MANPHYSKQYTVVVNNLSPETIEKTIFLTFKDFGYIKSFSIQKDKITGQSKCRAYINYLNCNEASDAQRKMNGKKIDGNIIKTILQDNKGATSSNKTNYQPLTDCLFFENGDCNPKNGAPCPYRHVLRKDAQECSLWKSGNCKNLQCIYQHPAKKVEQPIPKISPACSINPYTTRASAFSLGIRKPKPTILIKEGMYVAVEHDGKDVSGVVRWIGIVPFISKEDTFVGVELDSKVAVGTDGTFQSQRYFDCTNGHALFVKDSMCKEASLLQNSTSASDEVVVKKTYICGHYLNNVCVAGDRCSLIHPPVASPFTWCYKLPKDKEYKFCSANLNAEIEKAYSDPKNEKFEKGGSLEVCFENLDASTHKSLTVTFKRFSTKSISCTPTEPSATRWRWYWLDDNRTWSEYQVKSATSDILEIAYNGWLTDGQSPRFKFSTSQFPYKLDFSSMIQKNMEPKYKTLRDVRRRPEYSLARPLSPSPAPPLSPVSLVERYPSHWATSVPLCGYQMLPVNSETRRKIEAKFGDTMRSRMRFIIVSIEEICNKEFYDKYECKMKTMRERSAAINEMQLWHGTSHTLIEKICHQNFDWRVCKKGAYGQGSYFARDASYSCAYADVNDRQESFMFLADVLVGTYCQLSQQLKIYFPAAPLNVCFANKNTSKLCNVGRRRRGEGEEEKTADRITDILSDVNDFSTC